MSGDHRLTERLPAQVCSVLREFRTCEFATVSRSGDPVAWPIAARFLEDRDQFLLTTSIGMPQKALNIRRDARVSLSYSDPTASGLTNAPIVLVQGTATVTDNIVTSMTGLEEFWRENIFRRQQASDVISNNRFMRWFMDWYYMRLLIYVTPEKISWWDPSEPLRNIEALDLEVAHVG